MSQVGTISFKGKIIGDNCLKKRLANVSTQDLKIINEELIRIGKIDDKKLYKYKEEETLSDDMGLYIVSKTAHICDENGKEIASKLVSKDVELERPYMSPPSFIKELILQFSRIAYPANENEESLLAKTFDLLG